MVSCGTQKSRVWNEIFFAGEINKRDTNYVKTEISLIQQIMKGSLGDWEWMWRLCSI